MKLSTLLILSFPFLLGTITFADNAQCGSDAGGALCPNNLCCSRWGFCGNTDAYCRDGCQSQCSNERDDQTQRWNSFADNAQCGRDAGGVRCPNNLCCSRWGFCGNTDAYCRDGCQSQCSNERDDQIQRWNSFADNAQCGRDAGGVRCPNNLCCSRWGFCGNTDAYCRDGCQSQCRNSARLTDLPRALLRPTNNINDISKMISESLFNEMFKHRKDCPSRGFYSYKAFITAAGSFPGFCTSGDVATRKRELAAFLSQTSQATTGQRFDSVVGDPHAWGYCHINGTTKGSENEQYCTSSNWPCASGRKYNSRGPIQLTHNYNYGLAGEALGIDLINVPDLVATNPIVSFKTAIWLWMTQHDNNPSLHVILINANSDASDQVPSYGVISNIINSNSGRQSGLDISTTSIGYYKRYCDMLGVSYGDNLKNWFDETPFSKVARIEMSVM